MVLVVLVVVVVGAAVVVVVVGAAVVVVVVLVVVVVPAHEVKLLITPFVISNTTPASPSKTLLYHLFPATPDHVTVFVGLPQTV